MSLSCDVACHDNFTYLGPITGKDNFYPGNLTVDGPVILWNSRVVKELRSYSTVDLFDKCGIGSLKADKAIKLKNCTVKGQTVTHENFEAVKSHLSTLHAEGPIKIMDESTVDNITSNSSIEMSDSGALSIVDAQSIKMINSQVIEGIHSQSSIWLERSQVHHHVFCEAVSQCENSNILGPLTCQSVDCTVKASQIKSITINSKDPASKIVLLDSKVEEIYFSNVHGKVLLMGSSTVQNTIDCTIERV